jgi:hypothetical protein
MDDRRAGRLRNRSCADAVVIMLAAVILNASTAMYEDQQETRRNEPDHASWNQ